MSVPEDREHGAAGGWDPKPLGSHSMAQSPLKLMATYGPILTQSVHEPKDWEWVADHDIGRGMGITAADVVVLSSPTVFSLFRPLVANAVLAVAPAPEELDRIWDITMGLEHRITPYRSTEPITLLHAAEAEKGEQEWAWRTLTRTGWHWNAELRKAKRTPQKGLGTGNRPREFLTHVVLVVYDESHTEWCERTGLNQKNPQPLREEIGQALRWFFPAAALAPEKGKAIYNAIHNKRKKGFRRP